MSARPLPVFDPGALSVRCVESTAGLAELESAWESLHAASGAGVFMSWIWQSEWWRAYGDGRELRVFVVSDGGGVQGIVPLYVDRIPLFGGTARELRAIGMGSDTHPGYLGPLLRTGRETEVAEVAAEAILRRADWDALALEYLDPGCPFTRELRCAARAEGARVCESAGECSWIVELPRTHQALLERYSRTHRKSMRHRHNKLRNLAPRYFLWEDETRLDAALDRLIELHHLRWRSTGERYAFSSPQYVAFHRAVMQGFLRRGWLRLHCLELEGRIVAMDYSYCFRREQLAMQAGYDPQYAPYGIGRALLEHAIEYSIGEGNTVFDLLQGASEYKREIATGTRGTVTVRIYRRRPVAFAWYWRQEVVPGAKRRIKRMLAKLGTGPEKAPSLTPPRGGTP